MNLEQIFADYFVVPAFVMCLVVGYCIKNIEWLDKVGNEYIPTILAILGAIIGCIAGGVSLYSVIAGAASGLAATGCHQIYAQYIEHHGMIGELPYMGPGEDIIGEEEDSEEGEIDE